MMITFPRAMMALAFGLTVATTGCVNDGDPAKGGFLSGVVHMSSGTYSRRVQEREETLQNENDSKLRNERMLERVQAQSDAVSAQRQDAEQRFAQFNQELDALQRKAATAKADNAALQSQIDALKSKLSLLERDSFTPEPERQARLDQLRKEKDALERQIDLAIRR